MMVDDDHFGKLLCVFFRDNLVILMWGCDEDQDFGHKVEIFVKRKFGTHKASLSGSLIDGW